MTTLNHVPADHTQLFAYSVAVAFILLTTVLAMAALHMIPI